MKNTLLRLIVLLTCLCVLTACGGKDSTKNTSKEEESTAADYSVTVTDYFGTPLGSGVVVIFMKDGKQVAMQVADDKGVAVKNLEKGEYTVELKFTDANAEYSYEKATLSAEKTSATVKLINTVKGVGESLYAPEGETTAYTVKEGGTAVTLKKGRNYFTFVPLTAGTYEFTSSDKDYAVGYYGMPSYVQAQSAAEVVDNSFTVSIIESMIGKDNAGTTVIVLGLDAEAEGECILSIKRIGDPEHSISDEPWTIYKASTTPAKFTLESGVKLNNFDLTAKTDDYTLVYNEDDQSYHLGSKDGNRVYVWLAEEPAYMASFKTILESVGVNRYFFDEKGEFVKKESYTDCLLSYIDCADSDKGVYPLTKDLEYIIKQSGEQNGWWKTDSHGFIFYTDDEQPLPNLNSDIAWLFMCCYAG